jgi:hypothetical protein
MRDDLRGEVIDLPRHRPAGKPSIVDMIDKELDTALPEAPEPEQADESQADRPKTFELLVPLPQPGDQYKAFYAQPRKPECTLFVVDKDCYFEGFYWGNYDGMRLLRPKEPNGGPVIALRFGGLTPAEVLIEGLRLEWLRVYLGLMRVAWIWEAPAKKGFFDPKEPLITSAQIVREEGK